MNTSFSLVNYEDRKKVQIEEEPVESFSLLLNFFVRGKIVDQEKKLNRKNNIPINASRRTMVRMECVSNKSFIAIGFMPQSSVPGK